MNYIGSKLKLASFLKQSITSVAGNDLSEKTFCDIFAGTGIVGRTFKSSVRQVIANDIERYSYVLNKNYIENSVDIPEKFGYLEMLNDLPPCEDGFVYLNYCLAGNGERSYFSDDNGRKIDAVRLRIQRWMDDGRIGENLYYFLLCSLLESADRVANTASVYGAFLKEIKKSAQKPLVLEPASFEIDNNVHRVYMEDANGLVNKISGDILYMDPPYNERQYGANYHLLNTIAEYREFVPKGKTGLPDYGRSPYCSRASIKDRFEDLVRNARFKYLFLSYNNEGLMSVEEIRAIMGRYGRYDLFTQDYRRFKADRNANRTYAAEQTTEYLHVLEK